MFVSLHTRLGPRVLFYVTFYPRYAFPPFIFSSFDSCASLLELLVSVTSLRDSRLCSLLFSTLVCPVLSYVVTENGSTREYGVGIFITGGTHLKM